MIITPELQKSIIDHLEKYISILKFQRQISISEWAADQNFVDKYEYQIIEAEADLLKLKLIEK